LQIWLGRCRASLCKEHKLSSKQVIEQETPFSGCL
jgi:hypothetical protein